MPSIMPSGEPVFPEFLVDRGAARHARHHAGHALDGELPAAADLPKKARSSSASGGRTGRTQTRRLCDFIVQSLGHGPLGERHGLPQRLHLPGASFRSRTHDDPPRLYTGIILLDRLGGPRRLPGAKTQGQGVVRSMEVPTRARLSSASLAGEPLIPRTVPRRSIYVSDAGVTPGRSSDKVMRTNAVADLFSSGAVYAPLGHRWVEQVGDEMGAFPLGEFDDLHDAAVWGLLRIRQGNLIHLGTDEEDLEEWKPRYDAVLLERI